MTGLLRRSQPLTEQGQILTRPWYDFFTDVAGNVNGLVQVTLYTDTGAVNAMVIDTGLTNLARGVTRYVKPAFTNTSTTVTLNDSGTGAKALVLSDGSAPAIGQIVAGVTIQVQYNGTKWEIVNLTATSQTIPGNLTVGGNLNVLGSATLASIAAITSGTYTPTLFNTTNVAASTAAVCGYQQIFDRVYVFGQVTIDPTGAGVSLLGMSLPVASNLAATTDLCGTGAATTVTDNAIGIHGDVANDRAAFNWVAVDISNHLFDFSFAYRVL